MTQVLEDEAPELFHKCGELRVHAAPLRLGRNVRGAVVYGWTFDTFSSSLSCHRIARQLGVDGSRLWAAARLESPTPSGRMVVYAELLQTMISSAARHVEAVEKLEDLSRMRDVFLAGVSHELRTPLAVLDMRIEVLLRGLLDDPAKIRAGLLQMKQHVMVEAKLVEDLIEAARTRTGQLSVHKEPVSLETVLRAALAAVLPQAEAKRISVTVPSLDGLAAMTVSGDAHRLQQVFWNLLSNSVKFTPAEGRVEVRVSKARDAYEVIVSDTGRGIDPVLLPRVFEAFTKQLHANAQGLGLGLSIARHIVELHGGTITVESAGFEQGTTFRVVLPSMPGTTAG